MTMTMNVLLEKKDFLISMFQHLMAWICKSKMSFYGQELNLPWWFGAACWGYAVAGLTLLWTETTWIKRTTNSSTNNSWFPYRFFALELIVLQSPLSYCADYVNMSNDSIFHPLDRVTAVMSMSLECCKICTLIYANHRRTGTFNNGGMRMIIQAYVVAAVLALLAFSKSQTAQEQLDRDGFVLWHFLWHLYPLVGSVIALVDQHCYFGGAAGGGLLPTVATAYRVEIHKVKQKDRSF